MEKSKRILQGIIAIAIIFFGCSAIAGGSAVIKQGYTAAPILKTNNLKTQSKYTSCGYGTHIRVINRSDYDAYVRIPDAGGPDFHLNPQYEGDNIDYIDSEDYYPSLRIIILADDDYTVLYDGYVQNCHDLYIDNAYSAKNALTTGKKASAKLLRVSQQ